MLGANLRFLYSISNEVRKDILRMSAVARSNGVAEALSWVDFLTYLYWIQLNIDIRNPKGKIRDRLVFGDNIASAALYAVLAKRGFLDREQLWCYRRLGAILQGYPDIRIPGVDAPATKPNMALELAIGIALSLKTTGTHIRTFCLLRQPTIHHEALVTTLLSPRFTKANNLSLILSIPSTPKDALVEYVDLLKNNLINVNIPIHQLDGHDIHAVDHYFKNQYVAMSPNILIIQTQYGKSIPFLETTPRNMRPRLDHTDVASALSILEKQTGELNHD